MKKTKTIIRKIKESKSKTKQKQKQSVNVNVHIDQSKKATPRTPKPKPDSAINPSTTLPQTSPDISYACRSLSRLRQRDHTFPPLHRLSDSPNNAIDPLTIATKTWGDHAANNAR